MIKQFIIEDSKFKVDLDAAYDILDRLKIAPTPLRIGMVGIILEKEGKPFSIAEVWDGIVEKNLPISETSMSNTLQMFHRRSFIKPCSVDDTLYTPRNKRKQGRPQSGYVVLPGW